MVCLFDQLPSARRSTSHVFHGFVCYLFVEVDGNLAVARSGNASMMAKRSRHLRASVASVGGECVIQKSLGLVLLDCPANASSIDEPYVMLRGRIASHTG